MSRHPPIACKALNPRQGVSDTPAWVVSEANMYARLTGKAPFVIYQGSWSALDRDIEREIIPMCRVQGEYSPAA